MKWRALPIILVVIIAAVSAGCESQQDKEARIAKEKQGELELKYRKSAILLALKYKVAEHKVFNLLAKEENFLYSEGLSGLKERIKAYSEQYDIQTDIIASILIDYMMFAFSGLV